jgi:orotate phosphoribosyltransferase
MSVDIFASLAARRGHFLLESGLHADLWLTLDALFVDPDAIAPLVIALGDRLRLHNIAAVCGPLTGGAFLAQAIAIQLGMAFYYTEPVAEGRGLFAAEYRLPLELRRHARERRVAVVDDIISAGSSVRATVQALEDAGASTAVVGALLILGTTAIDHFAGRKIPIESLARRDFATWKPHDCPLCEQCVPLEEPGRLC